MQNHLRAVSELFDQLTDIGSPMDESQAVSVILASLNDDYENIITVMEAWDEKTLTLAVVKSKLLEEWEKKKEREMGEKDVAMVSNRNRYQNQGNWNQDQSNGGSVF